MAWKGRTDNPVQFEDLLSILANARIQKDNPALYQTISEIIKRSGQNSSQLLGDFTSIRQQINEFGDLLINIQNEINNITNNIFGASFVPVSTGAEPLEIMSNGAGSVLLVPFVEN